MTWRWHTINWESIEIPFESFFSSMTVIVKSIWESEISKMDNRLNVKTTFLKEKIKLILMTRSRTTFDEVKYDSDWEKCYAVNDVQLLMEEGVS